MIHTPLSSRFLTHLFLSSCCLPVPRLQEGCLLRAIELGKNSDLELRILGLGTVRHLVINTRVKRPFYEQGGLSPVFMGVEVSVVAYCQAV